MSKTPSNVSFVASWSLLARDFLEPYGAPQKAPQSQFLLLACALRPTHRLTYALAESAISWTILSRFEGCATARGEIDRRFDTLLQELAVVNTDARKPPGARPLSRGDLRNDA